MSADKSRAARIFEFMFMLAAVLLVGALAAVNFLHVRYRLTSDDISIRLLGYALLGAFAYVTVVPVVVGCLLTDREQETASTA